MADAAAERRRRFPVRAAILVLLAIVVIVVVLIAAGGLARIVEWRFERAIREATGLDATVEANPSMNGIAENTWLHSVALFDKDGAVIVHLRGVHFATMPWDHVLMGDVPEGSEWLHMLRVEQLDAPGGLKLSDLQVETVDIDYAWSRRISLQADVASSVGPGRIEFRYEAARSARSVHCLARHLVLKDFEPLARRFIPDAELTGNIDLDVDFGIDRDGVVAGNAKGEIENLSVRGSPWIPMDPVGEKLVRCDGSFAFDPNGRTLRCDALHLESQAAFVEANGALAFGAGPWTGDLDLRAGVNFDRAALRYSPLLSRFLHWRAMGGDADLRVQPHADGGFQVTSTGKDVRVQFAADRAVAIGEMHFAARARGHDDALSLSEIDASTRWLDAKGALDLARDPGSGRIDGSTALDLFAPAQHLVEALVAYFGPLELVAAGEPTMRLDATLDAAALDLAFSLAAPDLDVRYDDVGKDFQDAYGLRGRPFAAKLSGRLPRDLDLARATATIDLDLPKATWLRDEMEDLKLHATVERGALAIDGATAKMGSGTVRGDLHWDFAAAEPALAVAVAADAVEPRLFRALAAGAATGIFAAENGPYRMTATTPLSGSIEATARGHNMTEMQRNAEGHGSIALAAGAISGSPLLEHLLPAEADGSRRIDGAHATLRIERGALIADPVAIDGGGRTFHLTGRGDTDGAIDFVLDPADVVPPQLLRENPGAVPPDLFALRGSVMHPVIRLPDAAEWSRIATQEQLAAAVQKLLAR